MLGCFFSRVVHLPGTQNTTVNTSYTIWDKLQYIYLLYLQYMLTVLAVLTITLLGILAAALLTMLTIVVMFTILTNEVQNDYGVYEKIPWYNSKSPDTLYIYAWKVN